MGAWDSFFVAQVSASAALTGLVFVALSINLARVMTYPQLVQRAAEALIVLVAPVLIGMAILMPSTSLRATGLTVLAIAVLAALIVNLLLLRARAHAAARPAYELRVRVVNAEFAVAPQIIGGILLIAQQSGGLRFVALGAGLSIVVGMFDAWVLLVEILR